MEKKKESSSGVIGFFVVVFLVVAAFFSLLYKYHGALERGNNYEDEVFSLRATVLQYEQVPPIWKFVECEMPYRFIEGTIISWDYPYAVIEWNIWSWWIRKTESIEHNWNARIAIKYFDWCKEKQHDWYTYVKDNHAGLVKRAKDNWWYAIYP